MDNDYDRLIEQFLCGLKDEKLPSDPFLARVAGAIAEADAPVAAAVASEQIATEDSKRLVWQSRLWTAFCIAVGVVAFIAFKAWQPLLRFLNEVPLSTVIESYALPLGFSLAVAAVMLVLEHEKADFVW